MGTRQPQRVERGYKKKKKKHIKKKVMAFDLRLFCEGEMLREELSSSAQSDVTRKDYIALPVRFFFIGCDGRVRVTSHLPDDLLKLFLLTPTRFIKKLSNFFFQILQHFKLNIKCLIQLRS